MNNSPNPTEPPNGGSDQRLVRRCVDSPDHPWDGKEVVLLGEAVEVTEPTWICGLPTGGHAKNPVQESFGNLHPANSGDRSSEFRED